MTKQQRIDRARTAGQTKSEKRAAASRENGKKGGRPKKIAAAALILLALGIGATRLDRSDTSRALGVCGSRAEALLAELLARN